MPVTPFVPPYNSPNLPGYGNTQTHTPNTYVTPVNDTIVIPDLNTLPTITGSALLAADYNGTTDKLSLQALAQWLSIVIPALPFNPNTTPANWNPSYQFQYLNTNQTISIDTMVIGTVYSFYASGTNVTITFSGGTLIGYTNTGNSTTQLLLTNQVYSFIAITNTIVALVNADLVELEDPTNSNALTPIQDVVNNIYNLIPLQIIGTWTPSDSSGANIPFTITNPNFIKTGNQLTISATIEYGSNSSSAPTLIGGFPYMPMGEYVGCAINTSGSPMAISLTSVDLFLVNPATGVRIINSSLSLQTIKLTISYQIAS